MSIRWVLTDEQWAKMEPQCLGKPSDPGRSGTDNRRFVEAVLWIARTDALGNLVKFVLMPGRRDDTKGVKELIADVRFGALLGDKAFDVNWLIQELDKRGAQVVIS